MHISLVHPFPFTECLCLQLSLSEQSQVKSKETESRSVLWIFHSPHFSNTLPCKSLLWMLTFGGEQLGHYCTHYILITHACVSYFFSSLSPLFHTPPLPSPPLPLPLFTTDNSQTPTQSLACPLFPQDRRKMWRLLDQDNDNLLKEAKQKEESIHCLPSAGKCPATSWEAEPQNT